MSTDMAENGGAVDIEGMVNTYADFVYNVAVRLLCDASDAEEVTYATFLAAQRQADKYSPGESITTWLCKLTAAAVMNKLRSHRPDGLESGCEEFSDGEIGRAVCSLEPDLRMVLVLRDFEGLSSVEAADVLDVSLPIFRERLHRARMALQDLFGGADAS